MVSGLHLQATKCVNIHEVSYLVEPVLLQAKENKMADFEEDDLMESDSELSDEEVRFYSFGNRRVDYKFLLSHALYFWFHSFSEISQAGNFKSV